MRTVGGEHTGLTLTMYVAALWAAPAVGDLCALDVTANWTVTDTINDTIPFGKIVQLSGNPDPGSGLTIATVEVFGYTACMRVPTNAAIAVGSSIQTNGAGANNIEAAAAWNGTLVVADPGGAGDAYVLH